MFQLMVSTQTHLPRLEKDFISSIDSKLQFILIQNPTYFTSSIFLRPSNLYFCEQKGIGVCN